MMARIASRGRVPYFQQAVAGRLCRLQPPLMGRVGDRLVRSPNRRAAFFLLALAVLLCGYALGGKWFAYLPFGPVYVGEGVLAVGLLAFITTPQVQRLPMMPSLVSLLFLMAWCMSCTVPYVEEYGMDAFRDAALWGYASFALLVMSMVFAWPALHARVAAFYDRFAKLYIIAIPLVWVMTTATGFLTFMLPSGRTAPVIKGNELLVHLAGLTAFVYLRIGRSSPLWLLMVPLLLLLGSNSRGGLLAFTASIAVVVLLDSRPFRFTALVGSMAMMLLAFSAVEFSISVPGVNREFSLNSITQGLMSTFAESGEYQYEGTKQWRLMWWRKIIGYTLSGPYFWTGKGFGINLAEDDGFPGPRGSGLRSPHNSHLTFLARAGVPGFILWIVTQAAWLVTMLWTCYQARRRGLVRWHSLLVFLIGYWTAFSVSAAFDVFLEGPTAGIWFWVVFGYGLAVSGQFQRHLLPVSRPLSPPKACSR